MIAFILLRMARWSTQKRQEVRARILAEAKGVFETKGFESATMRDIATASGIAAGTLFNYFDDKRELLFAALHADLEEVHERCMTGMPGCDADLQELFVYVAGCYYDYYVARPALSRALLKESMFADGKAGAAFRAQVTRAGDVLIERVTALQERKRLRGDARQIVLAFMSHYYFVLLLELGSGADSTRMRHLIGVLAEQLTAGVGAPIEEPSE